MSVTLEEAGVRTGTCQVEARLREGAGGSGAGSLVLPTGDRIPLDRPALDALLADRLPFTGVAGAQVAAVVKRVSDVVSRFPDAARYVPGAIL